MKPLFTEKQRFNQWWLWLIILVLDVFPIYAIYTQFILGKPFGDKPMSNIGLICFCVFIWLINAFILSISLYTKITQQTLSIHFFPLVKKSWEWRDIKSAEVINYGFVGGWGIRLFTPYGTVYNIKGNYGLAITLNNGKRYVIGTQEANTLKRILIENNLKA